MRLSDYVVSGMYLTTGSTNIDSNTPQSTIYAATVNLSSGSTSAGNNYSSNYFSAIKYNSPSRVKQTYQVMLYNPSTTPVTCDIMLEETGLSTGSTQDYMYLTSINVPASSGGGRAMDNVQGLFNGKSAVEFRFYVASSGSSDSTNSRVRMAVKEWY